MEQIWLRSWFPFVLIIAVAAILVGLGVLPDGWPLVGEATGVTLVGAVIVVAVVAFGLQAIKRVRS